MTKMWGDLPRPKCTCLKCLKTPVTKNHPYPALPHKISEAGRQLGSGHQHRDAKGRFAAFGAGAASLGLAGGSTFAGMVAYGAHKEAAEVPEFARELHGVRNRWGAAALGGAAAAGGAMYLHGKLHEPKVVSKGLKQKLDNFQVTGDQARHASVYGQIGTGVGVVSGATVGAGIGAALKKPGQGAGIGAAVGGAIGGSGGASLGLYAGRPRKKKTLNGTAPVAKSGGTGRGEGAAIGAGVGVGTSFGIGAAANSAARRLRHEAGGMHHLADYKRKIRDANLLQDTADFHGSIKAKVGLGVAGAGVGYMAVRRHQQHKALESAEPVAKKMSDETKTKVARAGLIGAQVADIAAIKSAYHETMHTPKPNLEGVKGIRRVGAVANYASKKAALPVVAGGLVAAVGAERIMHNQQKKLAAQQPAHPKQVH